MKKGLLLLLIISSTVFYGCYSDDDSTFVDLQIEDALILENEKTYVVGDTIYFALDFSRYLEEDGFSNRLDIFETTGAASFNYPMVLEKFSSQSNAYVGVTVANGLVVESKRNLADNFNTIAAVLNPSQDLYESRIGVILAEPGDFRFSFDFLTLYPDYAGDRISLFISHRFTNFVPEDFEFEVTE